MKLSEALKKAMKVSPPHKKDSKKKD